MQEKSLRTRLSLIAGALAGALLIAGVVAAESGQATPATSNVQAASGPSDRGAGH
ncbi:hypothetical protein OG563_47155 [Nocardia vinacea]|uniref:Uncharacterized protein n=1 Tax=Nocardia vinacea TaxID=96468 RepID=A0ABZ1YTC2_9NOCA|nr:hypothetical protein [Nocardia vinacea]